jgi:tRNA pseudouridine38-40 synthase
MRDFQSFAAADRSAGEAAGRERSTVVLVDRLDVIEDGALVLVGIEGSHFLWKMVRRLVGVLVAIGRSELEPADAAGFVASESAVPATLTAPASGLFLARVYYKGDRRDEPIRPITPI